MRNKENNLKSLKYDEINVDGIYELKNGKSIRILNKHIALKVSIYGVREFERVIYHELVNEKLHISDDFKNVKLYSCMHI